MHFKTLALVLGFAGSAHAQVIYKLPTTLGNVAPISLPSRPVVPMILPSVDATIAIPTIRPTLTPVVVTVITPASLPVYPAPAIGQKRLPGVPSPLPAPAALASARRPAPSAVEEPFILNWSLLDDKGGDEPAAALVPNNPGPQPLSPAGALNALLRDDLKPGELFDGKRASQRELELPFNRYF